MRSLAVRALAVSRLALGSAYLLAPASTGPTWVGGAARHDGTRILARGLGARDLALGLGTLAVLDDEPAERRWMRAQLLCDAADFVATTFLERDVPRGPRLLGIAITGGATALAAVGAFAPADDAPPGA